ncbi:hypothetical protein LIER_03596 [Lithospermum erythrorhizon]|uniref:Uncharacterized protein n=1 Tax=Lithospermum erythrorhizon TaxID=34254 RepID=A0AAV3NYD1_LITER
MMMNTQDNQIKPKAALQMDLTEIESKLHALDKLYGLLLKNYEDTNHSSSDKLDDGARFMLKKLLDVESEKVVNASEILESKWVNESCSSQLIKDSTMNEKFRSGEVPFQAPIGNRADLTTDLILPLDNKRGSDDDINVSIVEISGSGKENLSSVGGPNDSSSAAISESLSIHNAAETSKKQTTSLSKGDADFVSVEALASVQKIQSHITDLKLDAQRLLPPRKRAVQCGLPKISADMMASSIDRDSPSMLMKRGKAVADTASSQARMGLIESEQNIRGNFGQSDEKQNQQKIDPSLAVRVPSYRFESLCNQIVPIDRLPSQNHGVRGFEFQEQVSKKSKWRKIPTARYISRMNKEGWDKQVSSSNEGTRKKLVDRAPHTIRPITRIPSINQHSSIKSPRLSTEEHEPCQPSVSSLNNKTKIRRRMGKEPMDHVETESTDSDYSAGTNQLSSDSLNEIDLNSGSEEIYTSENPSSRSESDDVDSLPRRTRHLPAGSTGSSETEVYSSASRSDTEIYSSSNASGSLQDTATSSSERQDYTSDVRPSTRRNQDYTSDVRPGTRFNQEQSYSSDDYEPSRQSGRIHTNTSQNSRIRKRPGGLKKLKDKLAIIFHHHHHHHHHHVHHSGKNDQKKPARAKNRGKSLWKRSKKVTDLEKEKEINSEQAVKKSMVRGARKNQRGHFNELVKGFLRHKRQSKRSSSSKLASKRSRINHESKKAPSKAQWWKMMQNHNSSKAHKKHILLK